MLRFLTFIIVVLILLILLSAYHPVWIQVLNEAMRSGVNLMIDLGQNLHRVVEAKE